MEIKEATIDNLKELCEIYNEIHEFHRRELPQIFAEYKGDSIGKEYFEKIFNNENAAVFIAENKNQIVGLIHIYIKKAPSLPIFVQRSYLIVEALIVKEKQRKLGAGKALMEKAEKWALNKGVHNIELNVWEFNQNAIDFYEKLGYKTFSRKMNKIIK